jgi:hypothetical protein
MASLARSLKNKGHKSTGYADHKVREENTRVLTHVYCLRLFLLKAKLPQKAGTARIRFRRIRFRHRVNQTSDAGKKAFLWNSV